MKAVALRLVWWCLLALPAIGMIHQYWGGGVLPMDLLHPSGETAVRLMVLALLPGPLSALVGPSRLLAGWLSVRRHLGVAAFGYAVLHLLFYLIDMRLLAVILDELTLPAIWTGWLALALMLAPAAISSDAAMRWLGARWKQVQRLVYAAFLTALAHWGLVDRDWTPAGLYLAPVLTVWILRCRLKKSISRTEGHVP